ncbi:unnamed protein product, partial [Meganyctiphanes norvegica]
LIQVSIQDLEYGTPYHLCGGTIYSAVAIITSATCVGTGSPQNLQIVAGEYKLNLQEGDEQIIKVSQIIPHPDYNIFNFANDIAILKLSKPLEFTHYVQAISLPPHPGFHASGECTMSGWGSSHPDDENLTDILQKIIIPILTVPDCNAVLAELGLTVYEEMVCAGYLTGGKNACIGDDGGPLTCLQNGHRYLAGVLSFDLGCNNNIYPGVYTAVEHYMKWIQDNA